MENAGRLESRWDEPAILNIHLNLRYYAGLLVGTVGKISRGLRQKKSGVGASF